ncbi:Ras guanine nucleotide exchange factor bud5 [Coemansia sp. RSA 988]|nr:Ras guanine nucleotide exchange factor bud5 [Coemansia sp. RSA 988]
MAFYYTQGDHEERVETNIKDKQAAPGIRDQLSQATEGEQSHRRSNIDSNVGRKREKGALRIATRQQGGQRREHRLAKIFNDIGDSNQRARAERLQNIQSTLPDIYSNTTEVLINSEGRVSYGTWNGIVSYLTQLHRPPNSYTRAFLMSFRSFATPTDLSDALIERAREILRSKISVPEAQSWYEHARATILHNVFLAIKRWYEGYWVTTDDGIVLGALCNFLATEYLPKCQGLMAKECHKLLQTITNNNDSINLRAQVTTGSVKSGGAASHKQGIGVEAPNMDSTPIKTLYARSARNASQHNSAYYQNDQAIADGKSAVNGGGNTEIHNGNGHRDDTHHRRGNKWHQQEHEQHRHKHHREGFFRRIFGRHSQNRSPDDSGSSLLASPRDNDSGSAISYSAVPDETHDNSSIDRSFLEHDMKAQLLENQKQLQGPAVNIISEDKPTKSVETRQTGSDASRSDEGPDISDLLMATIGVDLSLDAYRRMSHIYQVSPADVACQLTIIESSCYCQIQPYELLNKEFSRGSDSRATNVRQMSRWCTQITRWASVMILSETTPERRCRLLKYFIELGIQLLALKNYDAVMAIKAAIYSAAVMRLKRTWSMLPNKYSIMCTRIHEAMDPGHNYANYRSMLRRSQPPLLPFLGLYLTDLTFLEDGNPTYRRFEQPDELVARTNSRQTQTRTASSSNSGTAQSTVLDVPKVSKPSVQLIGQTCALFARRKDVDLNSRSILINFEKCNRVVDIINEMQKFQIEYSGNFTMAIPGLQKYLIEQWERCDMEGYDDDKIYNMSLRCEPRAAQLDGARPLQIPAATKLSRLLPGSQRMRNKETAASSISNSSI